MIFRPHGGGIRLCNIVFHDFWRKKKTFFFKQKMKSFCFTSDAAVEFITHKSLPSLRLEFSPVTPLLPPTVRKVALLLSVLSERVVKCWKRFTTLWQSKRERACGLFIYLYFSGRHPSSGSFVFTIFFIFFCCYNNFTGSGRNRLVKWSTCAGRVRPSRPVSRKSFSVPIRPSLTTTSLIWTVARFVIVFPLLYWWTIASLMDFAVGAGSHLQHLRPATDWRMPPGLQCHRPRIRTGSLFLAFVVVINHSNFWVIFYYRADGQR